MLAGFNLRRASARWFVVSVIGILIGTATAKTVSAFGSAEILSRMDPVFGVSNRSVLIICAGLEGISVALLCVLRPVWTRLAVVFASGGAFVVYRIAHARSGAPDPCPCLGNVTDALGLSPEAIDLVLKGLIAYFLIGSFLALLFSDAKTLGSSAIGPEASGSTS